MKTKEELVILFEDAFNKEGVEKIVSYPFEKMVINGVFSHYFDPDTDLIFDGFVAGFRAAEKLLLS